MKKTFLCFFLLFLCFGVFSLTLSAESVDEIFQGQDRRRNRLRVLF